MYEQMLLQSQLLNHVIVFYSSPLNLKSYANNLGSNEVIEISSNRKVHNISSTIIYKPKWVLIIL
jgi:hypothetical protein